MGRGAAGPYAGPYPADQYPAGAYPAGPPADGGYPGAGQPGPAYTDHAYVDGNGYAPGQYADGAYPDGRYAGGPQTQDAYPETEGAYTESSYAEARYPKAPYADERYPGRYSAGPGRGGHQGGGYPGGPYPDGQYRDGSYPSAAYAGGTGSRGRGPGPGRRPAGSPAAPNGPEGGPWPGPERQRGPWGPQNPPVLQGQALPADPAPVTAAPPPAPRGPGLDQPVKPGAAVALRKEPPAEPRSATPQEQLEAFAKDLRELRGKAGLGYPEMAELSHYTMKTLASAAGGLNLPTLPVTMAYVRACEGSVADWEDRWHRLADALKSAGDETGPTAAAKGPAGPGQARQDGADAGGRPPAGDRQDAAVPDYGRRPEGRGDESSDGPVRQEQAGRPRPRPSQVSTPPSAPEQEPPPPSDQVYVITSAVPRRPRH